MSYSSHGKCGCSDKKEKCGCDSKKKEKNCENGYATLNDPLLQPPCPIHQFIKVPGSIPAQTISVTAGPTVVTLTASELVPQNPTGSSYVVPKTGTYHIDEVLVYSYLRSLATLGHINVTLSLYINGIPVKSVIRSQPLFNASETPEEFFDTLNLNYDRFLNKGEVLTMVVTVTNIGTVPPGYSITVNPNTLFEGFITAVPNHSDCRCEH